MLNPKKHLAVLLCFTMALSASFVFAGGNEDDDDVEDDIINVSVEVSTFLDDGIVDANVNLYEHNELVEDLHSLRNGNFELALRRNGQYTIQVVRDGFVAKRIIICTNGIPSDLRRMPKLKFKMKLVKIKSFEGVDISSLDFPASIIKFDGKKRDFDYDKKYFKKVVKNYKQLTDAAEAISKANLQKN